MKTNKKKFAAPLLCVYNVDVEHGFGSSSQFDDTANGTDDINVGYGGYYDNFE